MTTGFIVEVAPWDSPDGQRLRAAQRAELVAAYDGDVEPGTKPTAADVSVFLLARDTPGEAVGCGALRHLGGQVAEIKRMYVAPAHRGRGVSRLVLGALEAQALSQGWTVLRLETGPLQAEAIGLYTSAGYAPIPAFGPYVGSTTSLCFERRLEPSQPTGQHG
ncbi:GNAT family N-acetyltransferase [Oryzihumus sp.]